MKTSELIALLQAELADRGDLIVDVDIRPYDEVAVAQRAEDFTDKIAVAVQQLGVDPTWAKFKATLQIRGKGFEGAENPEDGWSGAVTEYALSVKDGFMGDDLENDYCRDGFPRILAATDLSLEEHRMVQARATVESILDDTTYTPDGEHMLFKVANDHGIPGEQLIQEIRLVGDPRVSISGKATIMVDRGPRG